jgi:multicomponent Na+:H+ antiporter subunit E
MLLIVKRLVIFFLIWVALAGTDAQGLIFGAAAAAAATWASLGLLPPGGRRVGLLRVIAMLPGFLWHSARGGVDVAWRALHPSMPIRPGWLAWQTRLPAGGPRVSLGGEMSMLPGTLVAGSRGDTIYVHCLDTGHDVTAYLAREEARIAASIEADGGNANE